MGTWGFGALENDDACDVLATFRASADAGTLREAFAEVLAQEANYLEAPEAQRCVAAAEILSAMNGRGGGDETLAGLQHFGGADADPTLAETARSAVGRVLKEPSELLELWQASPDFDRWKSSVENILQRLNDL